jgi:hypothetical protein
MKYALTQLCRSLLVVVFPSKVTHQKTTKPIFQHWLIIAGVSVLAASSHSQNLVVNGSFESGATGWTFTGGLSILGPPALPAWGVDGTNCASLGGGDIPNSTISQTFTVSPGG